MTEPSTPPTADKLFYNAALLSEVDQIFNQGFIVRPEYLVDLIHRLSKSLQEMMADGMKAQLSNPSDLLILTWAMRKHAVRAMESASEHSMRDHPSAPGRLAAAYTMRFIADAYNDAYDLTEKIKKGEPTCLKQANSCAT